MHRSIQISVKENSSCIRICVSILVVFLTGLAFVVPGGPARLASESSNLEFANGRWYDGQSFVPRTFYSVDGLLTSVRPARVDSVENLEGKFVVPPFGDGHVHNLGDTDSLNGEVNEYFDLGVFYLMEMDPAGEVSQTVLKTVNRPDSVDVIYANGVLTPSWGVIPDFYRMMVGMGRFGDKKTLDQLDTHVIYLVDSRDDLEKKWPAIVARNPDLIKVIMAFSEEFDKRKNNQKYGANPPHWSAKEGIDPKLLPEIVQRAHAAGRRVSVHIETAADFHVALLAGVDIIAHLPASWQIGRKTGFADEKLDHWEISDQDAQMAADRKIVVMTTTLKGPDDPDAAAFREVYRHNLNLLKQHHAVIAIGSDSHPGSAPSEALYLASLGVFDNSSLLKMLCETTPQAIFPNRKIGLLRDGFEASFLALDGNPLGNLENIHHIRIRVKQGRLVRVVTDAISGSTTQHCA
jgi:hypothetical protein